MDEVLRDEAVSTAVAVLPHEDSHNMITSSSRNIGGVRVGDGDDNNNTGIAAQTRQEQFNVL
jgi:hypothetical protein